MFSPILTALIILTHPVCMSRGTLIKRITADKFQEEQIDVQRLTDHVIVETWANKNTGSWTMFLSYTSGFSCLTAEGTDWQQEKRT